MAIAQIQAGFGPGQTLKYPGAVLVEVDQRPDGLNQHVVLPNGLPQNPSSYAPGDTVFLLVYASPNVRVDSVNSSWGELDKVGPTQSNHHEELVFENTDVARLSRPCQKLDRVVWSGAGLGELTIQEDGLTVTASRRGLSSAYVWYRSQPIVYRLRTSAADCPIPATTAFVAAVWEHLPVPVLIP
ncbi:MAG: hypothetical protein HQM04_06515 [Magnetococcales bacterium]|nr:hypothetical protein [Magnetococcales bacterium]MBF0114680.1 hypothetical protein [Magnetococcales bacterium]